VTPLATNCGFDLTNKPIWDYHSQSWWTPPDDYPEPSTEGNILILVFFVLMMIGFLLK